MSNNSLELQCITAIYNNDLLCLQDDDTESVVAVARDEQHMIRLLEEVNKSFPIDTNLLQLNAHPESEIIDFLQNTDEIKGIVLEIDGTMLAIPKQQVLEGGLGPFLYYNSDAEPIAYQPDGVLPKDYYYLVFDNETLFKVAFGGYKRLLLVGRSEDQINDLVAYLYPEASMVFENAKNLYSEPTPEQQIFEHIKQSRADGIVFLDDARKLSTVPKDDVLRMGLEACFEVEE